MVAIRTLLAAELAWANECYGEIHFLPSRAHDFIAVAEIGNAKAGLGRLVSLDGTTGELGGMYVLPEFRGRNVAGAIVSYLLRHSPYRQLFCIPFAHLEGFYRSYGFQPHSAGIAIPNAIAKKVDWCAKEYADPVSLLVRETVAAATGEYDGHTS